MDELIKECINQQEYLKNVEDEDYKKIQNLLCEKIVNLIILDETEAGNHQEELEN